MVAAYLIGAVGWRWSFVIFGSVGVIWAAAFVSWFRDSPRHPVSQFRKMGTHWHASKRCSGALADSVACCVPQPRDFVVGFDHDLCLVQLVRLFHLVRRLSRGCSRCVTGTRGLDAVADSGLRGGWQSLRWFGGGLDYATKHEPCPRRQLWGGTRVRISIFVVDRWDAMRVGDMDVCFPGELDVSTTQATSPTWWACADSGQRPTHSGGLFGLMNGMGVACAMGSPTFFGTFVDWRKDHGYLGHDQWDPAYYVHQREF